jgi:hypothetical protein
MPLYDYQLGSTFAGMQNIESILTPVRPGQNYAPKHDPVDYSQIVSLGNGEKRGSGWLRTAWHWNYLPLSRYTTLKTYCTGLSASVFIKTKKNDGTYQVYTATMLWPEKEPEPDANVVKDITIEFIKLQVYTP